MLDAFIIERIRRERQEQEQERRQVPLRIEVPLPPDQDQRWRDSAPDRSEAPGRSDRGYEIIDFNI